MPLDFLGRGAVDSFLTLGFLDLAMRGSSSESEVGLERLIAFPDFAFVRGTSSSESCSFLTGVEIDFLGLDFALAARGTSSSESDSSFVTLGFLEG